MQLLHAIVTPAVIQSNDIGPCSQFHFPKTATATFAPRTFHGVSVWPPMFCASTQGGTTFLPYLIYSTRALYRRVVTTTRYIFIVPRIQLAPTTHA